MGTSDGIVIDIDFMLRLQRHIVDLQSHTEGVG